VIEASTLACVPPPWHLQGEAHGLLVWMPHDAGPGLMAFIHYADSDVGPYDELLWLEPWAHAGRAREQRVTRIFVSTESSVYNGRVNWGLPKELASFCSSPVTGGSQHVEVTSAGEPVASFTLSTGKRSLPFNARLIPARWRTLVQWSEGRRFKTVPSIRGRLHRARFSELAVNPALFPDVTTGFRLAEFSLQDFEMVFPLADVSSH
jgi:hypothetical protein